MCERCFFIGHRDAPDEIFPYIVDAVRRCIEERGITEFLVGGYGRFDALATAAVEQLRAEHPEIRLIRLLAYYDPLKPVAGIERFDGSLYPDGLERTPKRFSIIRANRYAVNHSRFVIAYVRHWGNSRDILEYAEKRVDTENLAAEYRA